MQLAPLKKASEVDSQIPIQGIPKGFAFLATDIVSVTSRHSIGETDAWFKEESDDTSLLSITFVEFSVSDDNKLGFELSSVFFSR